MRKRKYTTVIADNELQQSPHSYDLRQCKRPHAAPPSPESQLQEAGITSSIRRWLDNNSQHSAASTEESPEILYNQLDLDASSMTSQTPSARSRSSSPSKPKQAQNYRVHNLRYANIHIDVEVPDLVMERITPRSAAPLPENTVRAVAKQLYTGARDLLKRGTSNEDEWQELLRQAIVGLLRDDPDMLKWLPKRDWKRSLKPVAYVPSVPQWIPQKRQPSSSQPSAEYLPTPPEPRGRGRGRGQTATSPEYPSPNPSSTSPFSNKPDMAPPTTTEIRVHYVRAPDSQQPKTPKPDLTIGLLDSPDAWSRAGLHSEIGNILDQAQIAASSTKISEADTEEADWEGGLVSDPFVASPSGLRFPFLVVELKSELATLTEAENQTAVSGACALRILEGVMKNSDDDGDIDQEQTTEGVVTSAPQTGSGVADESSSRAASRDTAAASSGAAPATTTGAARDAATQSFTLRTYSLTTSGSTQCLWAHIPPIRKLSSSRLSSLPNQAALTSQSPYSSFSSGWDMVWLGAYRITNQKSALELTRALADILAWGREEFRTWVLGRLMEFFGNE